MMRCALFGRSRDELLGPHLAGSDSIRTTWRRVASDFAAGTPGHDSQAYRVTKRYLPMARHPRRSLNAAPSGWTWKAERHAPGQIIDVSDSVLTRQALAQSLRSGFRRSMAERTHPVRSASSSRTEALATSIRRCATSSVSGGRTVGQDLAGTHPPDDLEIDLARSTGSSGASWTSTTADQALLSRRHRTGPLRRSERHRDPWITDGSLSYFVSQIVTSPNRLNRAKVARSEESTTGLLANNQSDLVLRQRRRGDRAGVTVRPCAGWSESQPGRSLLHDLVHPDDLRRPCWGER